MTPRAEQPAPRVLVVDDDPGVRYTLREILSSEGLEVDEAPDGAAAMARLAAAPAALVLTDLRMPGTDGMALLRHVVARHPGTRVVLITAHGSERQAVEAVKAGAYDYFKKPFETEELLAVVRRAVEALRLSRENEQLAGELALARSMVFTSEPMRRLAVLVGRVAPRDVTVLICGESGTGKERVAEAIVRASPRAARPFVRFNCAALSPELAEAELFGHSRGAFTGAVRARPGLFREADGGTILLDEVAELAGPAQAKLLRVLQEGEVRPVGEERALTVDVRVLAATHRDLEERVRSGAFREDLYYRLNVVQLRIPPLRERPEDVPVLARHFLDRSPSGSARRRCTSRPRCSTGWRPTPGRGTCASWRTPSRGWWRSRPRAPSTCRSSPAGRPAAPRPGRRRRGRVLARAEAAGGGLRARPHRGRAPRGARKPQRGGAPARGLPRHAP